MVQEGKAPQPDVLPQPAKTEARKDKVHQSWGYRGLNTFAVTLTREDQPDEQVSLLMERRGLFRWKLAGIDLNQPG
ncbi:hypothetical protein D3C85_935730 [compost metagenome]